MALPNYSLLKGDPISGKVQFNHAGKNPHYHITVKVGAKSFDVAVNIQSEDESEVLYLIDHALVPPQPDALKALAMGLQPVESKADGFAVDFVRETINGAPMIELANMQLLPKTVKASARHNDLQNEVVDLLDRAIADQDGTIYVFGDAYADGTGIHDIHMNQGNPAGSHDQDNGIWQDGAVFFNLPSQNDAWLGIFMAFQTQSWNTDDDGNVK